MMSGSNEGRSALHRKRSSTALLISDKQSSSEEIVHLQQEVVAIKHSLNRMEAKMEEKEAAQTSSHLAAKEWKECAMVMDRFFFVLYLILIAVSLAFFFPKPK